MPDGKPENTFAFDGEFQDADFAHKVKKFLKNILVNMPPH
jgi:hypothetical protein